MTLISHLPPNIHTHTHTLQAPLFTPHSEQVEIQSLTCKRKIAITSAWMWNRLDIIIIIHVTVLLLTGHIGLDTFDWARLAGPVVATQCYVPPVPEKGPVSLPAQAASWWSLRNTRTSCLPGGNKTWVMEVRWLSG